MTARDGGLFVWRRRKGDLPPLIRVDPRTLSYFAVVLLLVGLAGWLYLHQASQVATYAHEIRTLEQEKERVKRDIVALRAEVAELGSLQRVQELADAKGYTRPEATDAQRLMRIQIVAPVTPWQSEMLPPPESEEVTSGDLWQRLWGPFNQWLNAPSVQP